MSTRPSQLPAALEHIQEFVRILDGRRLALFLDYDGTLTPIVSSPEGAVLSEDMRGIVAALADRAVVTIVSGRDRADVAAHVDVEHLYYAGSHGFDIAGPDGVEQHHAGGRACLADLDEVQRDLANALDDVGGLLIERKRYTLAVHYRNAAPDVLPRIEQTVRQALAQRPGLRLTGGKKVFELRPNVKWDKGEAVLWLLRHLRLDSPEALPIYIGDDLTDEDAFAVLQTRGVGIVVGDHGQSTRARWRLEDVAEVGAFLKILHDRLPSCG